MGTELPTKHPLFDREQVFYFYSQGPKYGVCGGPRSGHLALKSITDLMLDDPKWRLTEASATRLVFTRGRSKQQILIEEVA